MFSVDQANLGNTQTAASDTTIRSEHGAEGFRVFGQTAEGRSRGEWRRELSAPPSGLGVRFAACEAHVIADRTALAARTATASRLVRCGNGPPPQSAYLSS
jgi:hypothetical protein